MPKPFSKALKITFFSFSLPLLFTSNAWAKNCTEKEIETHIINKNRPAMIDCEAGEVLDLLKALKKGETTSEFAGEALEYIDTNGKTIVPELIEAFKNGTQHVRRSAAWALVTQAKGKEAQEIVLPVLIEASQDQDLEVRIISMNAMEKLGSTARAAVPVLIDSFNHKYPMVRWNAAYALGTIGPDAEAAVPMLIERLKDENANVRSFATSSLSDKKHPRPKTGVP